MSFDIDPLDRSERFLLRHSSGMLFEASTKGQRDRYIDEDDCQDVTGIDEYETVFKAEKI